MTQFNELGLAAPLLKALAAKAYGQPTAIQTQAIPPILAGRDLIGLAQTGTGKTAAFALPILQRLNGAQGQRGGAGSCRCLVLAPTRELAAQIGESFRAYARFTGLTTAAVFGGASIGRQIQALQRGVDVLVATPGRLLDLVEQRACRLNGVEILVLDEADHMLDLGFIVPLKKIARLVPKARQTLLFSATMPDPIAALAADFLNDPVRVAVQPVSSTAERVAQSVIHVDQSKKPELLRSLLHDPAIKRALVFTRTKHGADRVVKGLDAANVEAIAIHGNKSQSQRERALAAFKLGRARLLVATEIAARGIDVENVTHVINYDLPDVPEQYVHRIGRTARAGAEGVAISFCAADERGNLRQIEKLTKQIIDVRQHALSLVAAPPNGGAHGPRDAAHRDKSRRHRHMTSQGKRSASAAPADEHRSRGRRGGRPGKGP